MIRVPYEELLSNFRRVLLKNGFSGESLELCARLFADASRDGVASHGLNRFPRFIAAIESGIVKVGVEPVLVKAFGAIERWDGCLGPGNLNAFCSMRRAICLSKEFGMGCVALRNTNHWMRAGAYGWQAAESGCVGICWTNTIPNMPPWGSKECRLGNNPVVFAVPRPQGHIVFDSAMSMYSYGKLESYSISGKELPLPGGFDAQGELTKNPDAILATHRVLPIGYWKGSGLSLSLDLIATLLSGGDSSREIGLRGEEYGLSQVFIAFDSGNMDSGGAFTAEIEKIIADLHSAAPDEGAQPASYPGERTLATRAESMRRGVPVDEKYWEALIAL
jgi:3-dehydro-L-gulonate 2-dehydrogenase